MGRANALQYFTEEGFKAFEDKVKEDGFTLKGLGWEPGQSTMVRNIDAERAQQASAAEYLNGQVDAVLVPIVRELTRSRPQGATAIAKEIGRLGTLAGGQ